MSAEPHGGQPRRMWLSDLSIAQPILICMAMAAVLVVGGLLYTRLGVELFPDVSLPVVAVTVPYPGADPAAVEREVVRPIEAAVTPLAGVASVRATSLESLAVVVIQFDLDRDAATAEEEVRAKIAAVRAVLPTDAHEPIVQRFDPSAAPILTIALQASGGQDASALRRLAEESIAPRLARIEGVGAATVRGGEVRRVEVRLDPTRLMQSGIPPQQIAGAIRAQNLQIPAGKVTGGAVDVLVGTVGTFRSLEDLRATVVGVSSSSPVRVADIATVLEVAAPQTEDYRVDGEGAVIVEIQRRSGSNTVRVADSIKAELGAVESDHAVRARVVTDESVFTREAVDDLQLSLLLGAILAALVVLLFFRDLRNTLVTVAGLPVVLLGTFAVMQVLGMSLNLITLMALSLSIGMLIDDAIVVRENIFRHMEESGESPRVASARGTAEIALAVFAVTTTIVAIFLPIAFTGGIVGTFLRDFGLVIVIAVTISLIEAFTFAPMLSAYLFHRSGHRARRGHAVGPLETVYRVALRWSLAHRLIVLLAGTALFAGSLAVVPLLETSFIPEFDQGRFSVNLELEPGSPLRRTEERAAALEEVILSDPAVTQVYTTVGLGGSVERARLAVRLRERGQTGEIVARIRRSLLGTAQHEERVSVDASSVASVFGSTSAIEAVRGRPIQFSVRGPDLDAVDSASRQIADRIAAVPGAVDVERSVRAPRPAVDVEVDRSKPQAAGLSAAQVGLTVRSLLSGEAASTYRAVGSSIPIVVLLDPAFAGAGSDVAQLPVSTARGTVRLGEVATVRETTQAARLERLDGLREITVGAGYLGRDQGVVLAEARRAVDLVTLPPGVTVTLSGQSQYTDEAFEQLLFAMALGILFVYMILASQFASLAHPFTIMVALPLSIVGALLALFAAGSSLDMLVMIGLILLLGLVAKNSILLVDRTVQLRRDGSTRQQALLRAAPARLRPILMTTLAMIFGMLPAALGFGAGAELRQNMAIAVIGGLVTSTLLTLVLVPIAYTYIDDLSSVVTRRFRVRDHLPDEAAIGRAAD